MNMTESSTTNVRSGWGWLSRPVGVVGVCFMIPEHSGVYGESEITGFPIIDREFTLETRRTASSFDDMITDGASARSKGVLPGVEGGQFACG